MHVTNKTKKLLRQQNQNNYKVSKVQYFTLRVFQLFHPVDENRALTHIKYDCKKSRFYLKWKRTPFRL